MAVNVLPLDRYLRGVVPWEAPKGWHEQTYEAQAVAARSYTLATLQPGEDFDLYPDARSQMYGGVAAERTETNLAIGATAGQVLVWRDRIVPGYYFSSSGGRTSSVHDAWPRAHQVPYLVSVGDPYDYISPHHVWPTQVLSEAKVASDTRRPRCSRHPGVSTTPRDVRAPCACSRCTAGVSVPGCGRADEVPPRLDGLRPPCDGARRSGRGRCSARRVHVTGFVRGLGRARLQELTEAGWVTVRHVHVSPTGRFDLALRAMQTTEFRLAYNGLAGEPVGLEVRPRGARLGGRPASPRPRASRRCRSRWSV